MMQMDLLPLRDELSVYQAPNSFSGSPSWTVFDPARNLYFSIDWSTFEVLCRWNLGDPVKICTSVNNETSLNLDETGVQETLDFLITHELVKSQTKKDSLRLSRIAAQRRQSWYKWILHSYLFFRVPLWNPDQWLSRTLPLIRWLGSRFFFIVTLTILLIGLIQIIRQWDSFSSTLVDFFSLQGMLAYAATLVFVKFIHELGHAYTAKQFGCRVPAMGIAFLVMFPMAYTDVNNAWRLKSRRQRLYVGSAGILVELSIAAWATATWAVLPDGVIKTAAFLLATTTWVSTLVINLSPFLRFDGYFLLMDYLEYPNLHARSFALARWSLREYLFKFDDDIPENHSDFKLRFLLLFAFCTWLYRLIVFSGIAVLVYLMFPKPLGPLLACIEVYWFILKPIWSEVRVWVQRRSDIIKSTRFRKISVLLIISFLIISLPWDRRIVTQGLFQPREVHYLTSFDASQVKTIYASSGEIVKKGQLLAELSSSDLQMKLASVREKVSRLTWQIASGTIHVESRTELPILKSQLQQIETQVEGLNQRILDLSIVADISGRLHWYDPDFTSEVWLEYQSKLGQIDSVSGGQINAYIGQENLTRIGIGDRAIFFSESGITAPLKLRVVRVDKDATRILKDEMLASTYGGEILVRESAQQLVIEHPVYLVVLEPEIPIALSDGFSYLRGKVVLYGEPESWLLPFLNSLIATLRREFGF